MKDIKVECNHELALQSEMWISKLLFSCAFLVWASAEEVLLDIRQGSLKGLKTTTVIGGNPYYSFKGIPYAKPNVGPNKFRQPEPAEPWEGVLDATKHRSTCVYYCKKRQGIFGEEDCLFLNIYTPVLDKKARKAVMVFIHPGDFNSGSGNDEMFGPDLIIDEDVILVTMNYRLGPIGFLSTGDANVPGNAGLKDQVMALKWLKENIQSFGGCPNRISLVGKRSGASSIQYHMLSPMSKGLFKNAIMQSGSIFNSWSFSRDAKNMAFKLGEVLGINTTDSAELVNKLSEFSAKDLVIGSKDVFQTLITMNGRFHAFMPVVEPQVEQEVFLPNDPWVLLKSAKFANVPLMIGLNVDETRFLPQMVMGNAAAMNEHFEGFIPDDLNITDVAKLKEIGESIKKFYFNGKELSIETAQEYVKLTTDIMYSNGILISSQIIASKSKQPVYEYLFSYNSPIASHDNELVHEFYSNALKYKAEPGTPSEKMTRTFIKLWTNFLKNRNPTSKLDDDVTVKWEPLGPEGNYMNINLPLKMEKGLFKDRLNFWTNLYQEILGEYASLFS